MPSTPHSFHTRIYYEDTDAAGIVYYANYLKFAERARTEALRTLGFGQSELWEQYQVGFVVKRCEVDYLSPARLDDEIIVETALHEIRNASMSMLQSIRVGEMTCARLLVKLACVNRSMKPAPFPESLRQSLTSMSDTTNPRG